MRPEGTGAALGFSKASASVERSPYTALTRDHFIRTSLLPTTSASSFSIGKVSSSDLSILRANQDSRRESARQMEALI